MKLKLSELKYRFKQTDKILICLVLLFILSLPLLTPRITSSDEIEYYVYLRSLYKDGDIDFTNDYAEFVSRAPEEYKKSGFYHTFLELETKTGLKNNFAPVGCSILWTPWFILADVYVKTANVFGADIPADGYSNPYIKIISYGSMFYGFLGLILIYFMLRRFFPPSASGLSVLLIWFATPVMYYMYVQAPMSHSCSLFTVTLFISFWHKYLGEMKLTRWIIMGALLGLAGLVREQNLFFVIILAAEGIGHLWEYYKKKTWKNFPRLVLNFLICGLSAIAVFSIQLITYKILNGHFGPSELVSRKMYWNSPFAWGVLFNYSHGLFFWTPVLFFALIGLIIFTIKNRFIGLALLAGFLFQVYISGAVLSWHASGSFGHRRFINCSIILAFGLAFILSKLLEKKKVIIPIILSLFFIFWNLQLIIQFSVGMMDRARIDIKEAAINSVTDV
ncbi:MAG: glycosyltransferase family 39 protein, partial [Acidobacteria bacterium]|nr:glycosyltransferase family 39 protein [Acidobacteriota bacterium]